MIRKVCVVMFLGLLATIAVWPTASTPTWAELPRVKAEKTALPEYEGVYVRANGELFELQKWVKKGGRVRLPFLRLPYTSQKVEVVTFGVNAASVGFWRVPNLSSVFKRGFDGPKINGSTFEARKKPVNGRTVWVPREAWGHQLVVIGAASGLGDTDYDYYGFLIEE